MLNSFDVCKDVIFTGGEVTLRKDIFEIIRDAKAIGYQVHIQTNGRMLAYKDFCNDLIKAGADIFLISIHGHTSKLHDSLTMAEGSFEQTVMGIRNILYAGKSMATNTVITQDNYRYLPDIAKLLVSLGVAKYQFAFPHILGRALENVDSVVPRKSAIAKFIKKGLDVGLRYNRVARVEAVPFCFLKGYERCVSEQYISDTEVYDINEIKSFMQWKTREGKVKSSVCQACKESSRCEGPWREYPHYFGWSEFKPIK